MFPNVRLMIVAILASLVGISCGMGLFAVFRVNHEPLARLANGSRPLVFADAGSTPAADSRAAPFGVRFQVNALGGAAGGNGEALRLAHGPVTAPDSTPPAVSVSALPSAPSPVSAGSAKASAIVPVPAVTTAAESQTAPAAPQQADQETKRDQPERTEAANEATTEQPKPEEAEPRATDEIASNAGQEVDRQAGQAAGPDNGPVSAPNAPQETNAGTEEGNHKDGLATAEVETPAAQLPAASVFSEAEPEMMSGSKSGSQSRSESGARPAVESAATGAGRRTIRARPARVEKVLIKPVARRRVARVRLAPIAQPVVQSSDPGLMFTQPAYQSVPQIQTETTQPVQRQIVIKRRRATKKTVEKKTVEKRAPSQRVVVVSTNANRRPGKTVQ